MPAALALTQSDPMRYRAEQERAFAEACDLTDGSSRGDWRLPNFGELYDLFHSIHINFAPHEKMDSVRWSGSNIFTGMQPGSYWSSTMRENGDSHAWRHPNF